MNVIIISNGNKPSVELARELIMAADIVYCCDGAANWAKEMNINIDVLLGDMDSIKDDTLSYYSGTSVKIITLPTQKDMTDTQSAADLAVEKGATQITFIGALGSRLDHTLANMHVLKRLYKVGVKAKIVDDKNIIYVAGEGQNKIIGEKGQCVSILPVGNSVLIENTQGLYYPINNRALYTEEPLGISNVFLDEKAFLHIKTGEAYIIISKD